MVERKDINWKITLKDISIIISFFFDKVAEIHSSEICLMKCSNNILEYMKTHTHCSFRSTFYGNISSSTNFFLLKNVMTNY